uniref:AB hydrolase-1 domain-containing protein n=1 Tax=Leersia perrieri TaxID=77586 RepID=A0A0D9XL42_9ORYZ
MADQIEHLHLPIRGLNIHIAQVGKDELGTVVFLHGFPEIWYSWRHQMLAAAAAGYRAVAPDCRGYGLSGQPPPPEEEEEATVWDDLVADVVAILDALEIPSAFLVGKDFGALPAYDVALRHPRRVRGVACLGVPFSPIPADFSAMPAGFYVLRWGEIMDLADLSVPLPSWLTEDDLDVYASLYEHSGFRFPLQMPYRSIHTRPNQMDARFEVPVLMAMGEKDYAFKFPGFEAAIRGDAMKRFIPNLKITFIPEGGHFVQEQFPEEVNRLLLSFFQEHPKPSIDRAMAIVWKSASTSTTTTTTWLKKCSCMGSRRYGTRGATRCWLSPLPVTVPLRRNGEGTGLSGQPLQPEAAEFDDLIEDLLAIFDALSVPRAFLVAQDFGSMVAYDFALRHPNRTCGLMSLGIPFGITDLPLNTLPEGFYVFRWGQPGRAEADFGRYDVKRVMRTIYTLFSRSEIPIAKEDEEIMDLADLSTPLPEWFTEGDLDVYSSLYEKSGFRYPLQMPYRSLHKRKPIEEAKFQVPVYVVMGEKDYVFKFPGIQLLLKGGSMEKLAPDLKITYIPEGCHFVQEQFPDYVNELLLAFLKDHHMAWVRHLRLTTSHAHCDVNTAHPRRRARAGRKPAMATNTTTEQHQIEHVHLPIRGLTLHVAQAGKGEVGTVLFLHGFPEIWYSWRHQMLAVAAAGYRAVAPDWRGYGLSDQPPETEAAGYDDLIEDLLAILDALAVPKAFLVGKDFGAWPAYDFALRYPNRTSGVMCLGIPFGTAGLSLNFLPEGFYVLRWAQPGRAEADFGWYDVKRVVRTIYILFSRSEVPIANENQEIMDLADLSTPLPEWFTEEDLAVYSSLYEKSGFRYPLQMPYRSMHSRKPIGDAKFQVPVFVVMGEKDYVFKFPGIESLMKKEYMEKHAPDLKITYIPEGSHFVQEQFPDHVNELLLGFLKDHPVAQPQHQQIEHVHLPIRGLTLRSMLAVAAAGYRAVAPEWRGYGLSGQPPEAEAAEFDDLIEDLLAILDALAVPKAFIVAKDFGSIPAYDFALRHPNRTCGVMCLGAPFVSADLPFNTLPEGFYMLRWAQPGRAEADFGRYDFKRVVRAIYILFSRREIPIAKEDQEIMDLADLSTPLPEWFTEEDLDVYSSLYDKSGFRYPLQMPYRSLHKRKPIEDPKFQVPVFVVMGEKDYVFKFPGVESTASWRSKHQTLKITYIPEGGHFLQEQFPDHVNELLIGFLKDHPVAA